MSLPAEPSLLRNKNFTLYLAARIVATVAVQMQSVAIGWQMYAATGKLINLGLIGLAQFAPFLALILPAGEVADRFSRRSIIALCFGAQLLCSLCLLFFSVSGVTQIWPVFTVLVLFGTARAFNMPAQQAILLNLVPTESFRRAMALSSSTFHVAVIVGPTLGGLLYLAGPKSVYATVAGLQLVAIVLMLLTRATQAKSNKPPANLKSLFEGLRFVFSRPAILGAMSLDLFAVLLGGAVALLPAYAQDVLHVPSTGLGLLRTAPGVGAALTSAVLAFRPIHRHVGRWMFGGVALFGAATLLMGLTNQFWIALIALFLTGVGDMVSVYVRHILVQLETPDEIRGRVSAVNAVFIGASNELGDFESGMIAAAAGLVPAILIGGGATLLVTILWARLFPVLSRMDRFPHATKSLPPQPTAPPAPLLANAEPQQP